VINTIRVSCGLLLALVATLRCLATETTPIDTDLAALIECRQDYRAHRALTPFLANPLAAVANGWQPLPQINVFMSEYRLLAPIRVLGYDTEHIAFTGTAIMAIIDLPDPRELAQKLALEAAIDTPEKVIYGREVFSRQVMGQTGNEPLIESAVLYVSTVASHPNKTLIGCDYTVENDDSTTDTTDLDPP